MRGGWGYLFGDEGSGYAIGIAALRGVMQAYDGRGPATLLSELLLSRYGLSAPPELVPTIYGADSPRSLVATLPDLVEQAADQGDSVALSILDISSHELTRAIAVIYPRLGASALPLVVTGGTMLHGTALRKAFHRACETQGLAFSTVHYIEEPAESALQLARKLVLD